MQAWDHQDTFTEELLKVNGLVVYKEKNILKAIYLLIPSWFVFKLDVVMISIIIGRLVVSIAIMNHLE